MLRWRRRKQGGVGGGDREKNATRSQPQLAYLDVRMRAAAKPQAVMGEMEAT